MDHPTPNQEREHLRKKPRLDGPVYASTEASPENEESEECQVNEGKRAEHSEASPRQEEGVPCEITVYIVSCVPTVDERDKYQQELSSLATTPPADALKTLLQALAKPSCEGKGKFLVIDALLNCCPQDQQPRILCDTWRDQQDWAARFPQVPISIGNDQSQPVKESFLICLDNTMVSTDQLCARRNSIFRLFTSGSIEEGVFLQSIDPTVAIEDFAMLTTSRIEQYMKDNRFSSVDEEFSSLWPRLLASGWHAEAGGGLADYHYCRPGFSSKKSKTKVKGERGVDFFASKEKVVLYIKNKIPLTLRVRLSLGIHDLKYFQRVADCDANEPVLRMEEWEQRVSFFTWFRGEVS